MTPSDLDEIRKRCEAANNREMPECSVDGCGNGADPRWFINLGGVGIPACDGHGGMRANEVRLRSPLPRWPNREADRAALVADVTRLLDEVERLQRERDAAWRQHDFVTEREKQIVVNLERADAQLSAVKAARDEACEALDEFAEVIGDVYSAPGAVQFFASLGIDEATVKASIEAMPVLLAKIVELRKAGE